MDVSSGQGETRFTLVVPTGEPWAAVRVANATTADLQGVLDIWNDGVEAAPKTAGSHDWRMSPRLAMDWMLAHQQHMRPLWIARDGEQPVALLSFIGFADRPGCHATAELAIHVRKGARGRGLGRVLVQRAVASAAMLGYDRYMALVRRDNKASLALFRRCGFRLWGRLHGVTQSAGRRHDLLVFGIEL